MEFNHAVVDIIQKRVSTRTYEDSEIDENTLRILDFRLREIERDATIPVRFEVIRRNGNHNGKAEKLSTYGVISGANHFILGITENKEIDELAFGYSFEKVILAATDLHLDTCWLGGALKREDFANHVHLGPEEYVHTITPIGHHRDKFRLMHSTLRTVMRSKTRKPWSELFFDQSAQNPLTEERAGRYYVPLEMVRLGPSGFNSQSWRILMLGNTFHFFIANHKIGRYPGYDLQKDDLGVAKCHFELAAHEEGLRGRWISTTMEDVPQEWTYVMSWVDETE